MSIFQTQGISVAIRHNGSYCNCILYLRDIYYQSITVLTTLEKIKYSVLIKFLTLQDLKTEKITQKGPSTPLSVEELYMEC